MIHTTSTHNKNSLDALRLGAALMVLYSHQYAILGLPEPSFLGWNTWGGAGVSIFFVLSGYLVWTSWMRDRRVRPFLARRALRIFPALWVVVPVSALFLGLWATNLDMTSYFRHPMTWRYFKNMCLWVVYVLPGVFPANAMPGVVNGSLWSLPVEFTCYLVVAAVGWTLSRVRQGNALALVCLWWLSAGTAAFAPRLWGTVYSMHFEMVAFFVAGVLYGQWRQVRFNYLEWLMVIVGLFAFAMLGSRGSERTCMLLMALFLIHSAASWAGWSGLGQRMGDLSYGLYIYAFPVQQALAHLAQGKEWPLPLMFSLSTGITMLLAYFSWHWIEKRALAVKPHLGSI